MTETTTRKSDVIDMLRDRSHTDALVYQGITFRRASYRGPGGRPLTIREANEAIARRLADEGHIPAEID